MERSDAAATSLNGGYAQTQARLNHPVPDVPHRFVGNTDQDVASARQLRHAVRTVYVFAVQIQLGVGKPTGEVPRQGMRFGT
jgi:hypothetical protein